jgi:DNA polymerase-1
MGCKIITGDRDLLQLVNARTAVYLAGDDTNYITDMDVVRKLGVRADQVVDYKAIVGDKSDNIPGVPGVGEKTAIALLEKFGTLDGIYEHLSDVEKRWATKLEAGKESAYRSYDLARIRTDLRLTLDLEHARAHVFDAERIEAFFESLEFKTLIKQLMASPTRSRQVRVRAAQLSLFGRPRGHGCAHPQTISPSRSSTHPISCHVGPRVGRARSSPSAQRPPPRMRCRLNRRHLLR